MRSWLQPTLHCGSSRAHYVDQHWRKAVIEPKSALAVTARLAADYAPVWHITRRDLADSGQIPRHGWFRAPRHYSASRSVVTRFTRTAPGCRFIHCLDHAVRTPVSVRNGMTINAVLSGSPTTSSYFTALRRMTILPILGVREFSAINPRVTLIKQIMG